MPRIARKYLESTYFHIIVQGINRENIFKEDSLKDAYKYILKKNLRETQSNILAYCIMDNHTHLLIYNVNIENIGKLMQKTNTSYAKLYNKSKNRVGYVFRDRYYSQTILTENQLYNCIAYIHKNPIKAGIINKESKYKYSSYNEYLYKKDLITNHSIKLAFGSDKNYIDIFNNIHKNKEIQDIIEVIDNIKSSEQIISEYLENHNKSLEEILKDDISLCELLLELRHNGGKSLRDMSEMFNINKNKLNRIINRKI